jgi:hypothetical protein
MTETYDDYIRNLQKLPDFHRLPLPDSIRNRLNIPAEYRYMGIKESVAYAFDNTQEYVNAGNIEIRDQTKETIEFPSIPEKHFLLEGLECETMTVTLEMPTEEKSVDVAEQTRTAVQQLTIVETDDDTPLQPPQSLDTPTESIEIKHQH